MNFFATAAKNTEPALRDELRELGFEGVRCDRGGVHFRGDWPEGWRCCLWSRIAMAVLAPLAEFEAPTPEALGEGVATVDWTAFLTPKHTLAARAVCRSSRLTHSGYVALRVKDAIVDQLRARCGARPSVNRDDPDVSVFVRLANDRATIALDLAGAPLHRRGYRLDGGPAPLKETLAATLLRMSGWDRRAPLADPLCGSGTIAIEAALWAAGVAPGRLRERFGFERWACHGEAEAARWRALRAEAEARAAAATEFEIVAGDRDSDALRSAEANARRAGVRVRFHRGSFETLPAFDRPGFIVTNPPYDRRLAVEGDFHERFAAFLNERAGDTVALLTGNPALSRTIRRKPALARTLFNGDLECRLLVYPPRH